METIKQDNQIPFIEATKDSVYIAFKLKSDLE
jgi:hypothetical protein